jgi:hypothetical protein
LLDEVTDIIVQDEQLKNSCLNRLHKLLAHIKTFENDARLRKYGIQMKQIHTQLDQRISQVIYALEPPVQVQEPSPVAELPHRIQKLIHTYSLFSVSRISIEKSGVLSIIQLLRDHPCVDLEEHRLQLQETLTMLERQVLYNHILRPLRNQCAYALVILMEMLKMHKGLPVLLIKIFNLCSSIQFPPPDIDIERELRGLKGRVLDISQKKLRPIIEDVLWKNPEYLTELPNFQMLCAWCYDNPPGNAFDITYIQRVVASTFERLLSTQQSLSDQEEIATSKLSKAVIELLELLVNVEPSPNFLRLHAKETLMIKQAKESPSASQRNSVEKLLDTQYNTYKNHLKFLQNCIDYYQSILDVSDESSRKEPKVPKYR